jgi:hypothetical protein
VDENASLATITTTLSAASSLTVTVDHVISDVTAIAGSDYTPVAGTLTFAPSQTSITFTVPIIDDLLAESSETTLLTLTNASNAVIGGNNPATLTIVDDDTTTIPTVQFLTSTFSVNEGDSGGTTIAANLSAASGVTITVNYATSDGTATAGNDYTDTSGTLTFAPGQTSQIFSVPIINDSDVEPNETIRLDLTNPISNATFGAPVMATLTIADDDSTTGCSGSIPTGEPNVGSPNGIPALIACGSEVVVDLGTTPISTHAGYDLVYFEQEDFLNPDHIALDWVIVQVGSSSSGPWFTVFYWGDGIIDTNTNIGLSAYASPETDNKAIPMNNPTPLYGTAPYTTGITIDVEARAPANTYQYVRLFSAPGGDDDPPNIDAIGPIP